MADVCARLFDEGANQTPATRHCCGVALDGFCLSGESQGVGSLGFQRALCFTKRTICARRFLFDAGGALQWQLCRHLHGESAGASCIEPLCAGARRLRSRHQAHPRTFCCALQSRTIAIVYRRRQPRDRRFRFRAEKGTKQYAGTLQSSFAAGASGTIRGGSGRLHGVAAILPQFYCWICGTCQMSPTNGGRTWSIGGRKSSAAGSTGLLFQYGS